MTVDKVSLPPELEREIFDFAARISPKTIPTMLRVARRVYVWVRPFLVQLVRVMEGECRIPLVSFMNDEPDFLASSVRYLCISENVEGGAIQDEEIRRLLTLCTHVGDLAITYPLQNSALIKPMHNLRRLICSLRDLFGTIGSIDPQHEALSRITHLELTDNFSNEDTAVQQSFWRQVCRIPRVTHLATSTPRSVDYTTLSRCLQSAPKLCVFVALWGRSEVRSAYRFVNALQVDDVRFMAGSFFDNDDDPWWEWEQSAAGYADDYWVRAEAFLVRKGRGEVDAKRYWMDDWMYLEMEA
ncbi:hypothetical protein MIND_00815600 [Mycena indigotica]|uniref:Uncharacterized protein n=1 Tax=Mycena indigotica TaxID=2126181 RepID=A0A8H6SFY1_9AGAR|nr:uncharacterized protein MIND_00815600 [Mycena indigotica]KAF7298684.1 hypothetical protein MIND_00815600 [Mycena indigotica]